MVTVRHPMPDMPDQTEQWLARLEADVDRLRQTTFAHAEQPWHASFKPMNDQLMSRLDRMEGLVIAVARWMIVLLLGILTALGAILTVAWRILESKPS